MVEIGLAHIRDANDLTVKEFTGIVTEIKKSVARHSEYGPGAYYEFIKDFV